MITNDVFDHWMLMALMVTVLLVSLTNGLGSLKERNWGEAIVEFVFAVAAVWVLLL